MDNGCMRVYILLNLFRPQSSVGQAAYPFKEVEIKSGRECHSPQPYFPSSQASKEITA